jgi:hypothetical protein
MCLLSLYAQKYNCLKIKDATVRTLDIIEDDCQILHCGLSLSLKVYNIFGTKFYLEENFSNPLRGGLKNYLRVLLVT